MHYVMHARAMRNSQFAIACEPRARSIAQASSVPASHRASLVPGCQVPASSMRDRIAPIGERGAMGGGGAGGRKYVLSRIPDL